MALSLTNIIIIIIYSLHPVRFNNVSDLTHIKNKKIPCCAPGVGLEPTTGGVQDLPIVCCCTLATSAMGPSLYDTKQYK